VVGLPSTPLAHDVSVGHPARDMATRLSSAVLMGHTGSAARGVLPFRLAVVADRFGCRS
jgi:hypothetical protein